MPTELPEDHPLVTLEPDDEPDVEVQDSVDSTALLIPKVCSLDFIQGLPETKRVPLLAMVTHTAFQDRTDFPSQIRYILECLPGRKAVSYQKPRDSEW